MSEEELGTIIGELGSKILEKYEIETVHDLFDHLIKWKPSFKDLLLNAKTEEDVETIFKEATGILNVHAGDGFVKINSALVSAITSAGFNHAQGTITIDGSVITAPRLVTGGGDGATGTTKISGTKMKSRGTEIDVGENASIEIYGNASIEQN